VKQFLKISKDGRWYGFAQAEDAMAAMQQHEEDKFLFPDIARRYLGAYIMREATSDDLPLRRVVEAIDKRD